MLVCHKKWYRMEGYIEIEEGLFFNIIFNGLSFHKRSFTTFHFSFYLDGYSGFWTFFLMKLNLSKLCDVRTQKWTTFLMGGEKGRKRSMRFPHIISKRGQILHTVSILTKKGSTLSVLPFCRSLLAVSLIKATQFDTY